MNILAMAKDLIKKGNDLSDPELMAMGMAMLEKYGKTDNIVEDSENDSIPVIEPEVQPQYECTHCQYTIPYDKPGRKKCPACKKHTLIVMKPIVQVTDSTSSSNRASTSDFSTQIRKTNNTRARYNENGEIEGTYTKAQPVGEIYNIWKDDLSEGFDTANEQLKKFTKVSPRTRQPVKMLKVVCDECKTTYEVHPIHAGGRAKYVCDKCMRRKTRI